MNWLHFLTICAQVIIGAIVAGVALMIVAGAASAMKGRGNDVE